MTARLDRAADETTARWLCHGCGETFPITGPAYPICDCGQRCRMVDADGLSFVGSPEDRLGNAQAEAEKAYAQWCGDLDFLHACLDDEPTGWFGCDLPRVWSGLVATATYANHTAEHLDRGEAEVARMEETTA